MNFRVVYNDADELLADHTAQFTKGGFLVRIEAPEGCELYAEAHLGITLGEESITLEGTVMQVLPGAGVAVGFESIEALEPLLELARGRTGSGGAPAEHGLEETAPEPETTEPESTEEEQRPKGPTRAEQIRMARTGERPDRDKTLREGDRSLQRFVLMNPGITLAEVKFLASSATSTTPTLKTIGEKREWFSRPEIAMAILRNPKTPVPIAIKMVPLVNLGELRPLVKAGHFRTPILNAARKRTV